MMMMIMIMMKKMKMMMMMMMMMRGTCLKHQQESCQREGGRGGCDKSPWIIIRIKHDLAMIIITSTMIMIKVIMIIIASIIIMIKP